MRTRIMFPTLLLLACVCLAGDAPSAVRALPTFEPVLQIGQVKVTLLQVSRVTSFSRQYLREPEGKQIRALPGVMVVYIVESLGQDPMQQLHIGGVEALVDGKPVAEAPSVVGGGEGTTDPWSGDVALTGFDTPPVASKDKSRVHYQYVRGVQVKGDRIDLLIEVGFGKLDAFKFQNVPLE